MLSLDGHWIRGVVKRCNCSLWIDLEANVEPGMSGSPIVNEKGAAVGVVAVDIVVRNNPNPKSHVSGPSPYLIDNLPGWLLRSETNKIPFK